MKLAYDGIEARSAPNSRLRSILEQIVPLMELGHEYNVLNYGTPHTYLGESTLFVVDEERKLRSVLESPFRHPVLIPGSSSLGQQISTDPPICNIADFFKKYDPEDMISVQALQESKTDAESWSVKHVQDVFAENQESRKDVINCLDIGPPIVGRNAKVPNSLLEYDLLRKPRPIPNSLARGTGMAGKFLSEFYMLSSAWSASACHTDSDGLCTWVRLIEGRKYWLWRTENDDQWSYILLGPGDTLLMPPGLPHAVFTPEDSLCVGGFALTQSHLATSMNIYSMLWDHPEDTNDDASWEIIEIYSTILPMIHLMDSDVARKDIREAAPHLNSRLQDSAFPPQGCKDRKEIDKWRHVIAKFSRSVNELPGTLSLHDRIVVGDDEEPMVHARKRVCRNKIKKELRCS